MEKYKLIASDLDGTLLKNDMTVSPEDEAAISEFNKRGILFVPTSGRTYNEIPACVRENPCVRYVTYSNGTAVYDKLLGKDIVSNRISKDTANKVFDILGDYDILCSIHVDGYPYYDKRRTALSEFNAYQVNGYYREILLDAVMIDGIEELGRGADGVEAIVIFYKHDSEMDECRKRLEKLPGITVTSSVEHNIELCSDKAGKGTALAALATLLGIKRESVVAVGDNMNDTSMFSSAGLSLCVGNGHEDAKALSDAVICSNEENIADYILKHYII